MLLRARQVFRFIAAHWKWFASGAAALGAAGAAGAILFAWLGLYNVAASRGHFLIVDRFLRFGMENSVETHAPDISAPDMSDPELVRLGAGHYYAGCAYCHGAPGLPITPVARNMLPPPPELNDRVGAWNDQELFFIIKHGFKYTGMPGWPVLDRDDEVWSVVAFLRSLPGLSEGEYRDLALGPVKIEPSGGEEIATGSADSAAIAACARCHGAEGEGPRSALVPRLHGQPAEMLATALTQYVDRARSSGIMQTAASGLKDEEIRRLADYYAALAPLPVSPAPSRGDAARGRKLALQGDPAREIPACVTCHQANSLPSYPRLYGQSARYMQTRLLAWKRGQAANTPAGLIMAPIASRLSESQMEDLAAYFSSQSGPSP